MVLISLRLRPRVLLLHLPMGFRREEETTWSLGQMKGRETDWMVMLMEGSAAVMMRFEFWRCCCFCLLALTFGMLPVHPAPQKLFVLASERGGAFGGKMKTLMRSFTGTVPRPP